MVRRTEHTPVEITWQPRGMLVESYRFSEALSHCAVCHGSSPRNHRQRHLIEVLSKIFTQANTHLMHSWAEIEIYELCLSREYPEIWTVISHAGFGRHLYLFAKWFSRYYNLVMPIIVAALSDAREALEMRMPGERNRLEGFEGFASDLAELKILVEKARVIDDAVHVKAMKEYLMRQLRFVMKTGESLYADVRSPWLGVTKTIRPDVFETLEAAWRRVYDLTKPLGSQFIIFKTEPFEEMMLQVPWPR